MILKSLQIIYGVKTSTLPGHDFLLLDSIKQSQLYQLFLTSFDLIVYVDVIT